MVAMLYKFIPQRNNYNSDTKAISYGITGNCGQIGYVLKSNYEYPQDYNLKIDALPFSYKLFINGIFVEEIEKNVVYNKIPQKLTNVLLNSMTIIELKYDIPDNYNLMNNRVDFNISITCILDNVESIIESKINIGEIKLNSYYVLKEYKENLNMFLIQYVIDINISSDIKLYDLQLKALYSQSCILDSVYKDGEKLSITSMQNNNHENKTQNSVISFQGGLIYPQIQSVDTTNKELHIQYSYDTLQYKDTISCANQMAYSEDILSLKTGKYEKEIILNKKISQINSQGLKCVYIDKVFGKCNQCYLYKDVEIPWIQCYGYKKIVFYNPQIIEGSLGVANSSIKENFSDVKYNFTIKFKIIYEGYDEQGFQTKYVEGFLEERELKAMLYTPRNKEKKYNIIAESIVKGITVNEDKTRFTVCIEVNTLSLGKEEILLDNLGRCNTLCCC